MPHDIKKESSEENKKDQKNTMSDKEKLMEEKKSESSEQSEDGKQEKEISSDSKSDKEPTKIKQKSSSNESPKTSQSNSALTEEKNEQEEFLKKQEKLIEHVSNIEKEQSVQSHLRPCKSCELLKPFPKRNSCCARLCRRKRTIPKEFWIVSVPGDPTPQEAFDKLKQKTEAKKLSLNYKFHIPELKIRTLDELMYLTDELKTLDRHSEDIVQRFIEFVHEVLEGHKNLQEFLEVNGMDVATYITRFTWNPAKYAVKMPLSALHDLLRAEIRRLGENLKVRMDDFRELDRSLEKIEKQQSGNLLTRSLVGIVKKEHFVLDSGYLTTLLVVVPKQEEKKWLNSYQGFADMVVPNSAMKIFEDKTHMLYTVVLCKKSIDEFKNKSREQKFVVRDFEYREEKQAEEKNIHTKLRNLKRAQIAVLRRWIKVNFSEGFAAWMHIKAIRVLVESALRFGLPSNFQAIILIPLVDKGQQLKNILNELYSTIDNELASGAAIDVPGTLAAFEVSEYDPYVFLKIEFDAS